MVCPVQPDFRIVAEGAGRITTMKTNHSTINSIDEFDLWIDGKFFSPSGQKYFDCLNPSTGEVMAKVAEASLGDVQKAVVAARRAFDSGVWSNLPLKERGQFLHKIAGLIRENAKELADLECLSTGKTIKQATFIDVPTAADCFEYFANVSESLKGEQIPVGDPVLNVVSREPVGVVVCIIPWNYPLIMAAWKMAPTLIAGNTVVFKPSPLGSVSIMKLVQLIEKVGLPKGVLNFVTSSSSQVSAELVKHPNVDMVSFSGGTQTGQDIMRLAAGTTKKLCLELGGKSPSIVFADCDLEAAVGGSLSAIFMNQGQMCTAMSRLLLEGKIYDEFLQKFVARTKSLRIGNSFSYETDFGPVISRENRDKILKSIETAKKEGVKVVCGGQIPLSQENTGAEFARGFYVEPTILSNVKNSMTIAQEEIFGPVLSVIRFKDKEEAVCLANDSKYGLAACIWTKDLKKANEVAKRLRCGTVWINTYGGFYNEVPFGGFKQSGFGRELGKEGLLEYTQTKNICTDMTPLGRSLAASWF